MDPFEVVRTLGSLAAMISAYYNVRRGQATLNKDQQTSVLKAGANVFPAKDEVASWQVVMAVIPPDVLEAANERIRRAQGRFTKAIRMHGTSLSDLDREEGIAREEVCRFLQLIRDHNQGELPTNELKKLWEAFNCGEQKH